MINVGFAELKGKQLNTSFLLAPFWLKANIRNVMIHIFITTTTTIMFPFLHSFNIMCVCQYVLLSVVSRVVAFHLVN
jgi:hypothetical protein